MWGISGFSQQQQQLELERENPYLTTRAGNKFFLEYKEHERNYIFN